MSASKIHEISLPNGNKIWGIEMDFEVEREDWNVYTLSDGTRLRTRNALRKVFKIVDDQGNPVYDPNTGEPRFFVDESLTLLTKEDAPESGLIREARADGSVVWYAIHPITKERVEIDPDQRWFWTPEWQAGERQVDEDLQSGNYEDFDDMESFINSL
jgi:hypothetical protein